MNPSDLRAAFICQGEHDKKYSGRMLLTDPARLPWMCGACGTTGQDVIWMV